MKPQPPRKQFTETQPINLRQAKNRSSMTKPNPNPAIKTPSTKPKAGFTLLEIMLVVIIIALLAGAAVHFMGGNVDIAQATRVKTDIQSISTQLKVYQAMNGFLPTTEQGLKALVEKPGGEPRPSQWHQFFEKVPHDPWDKEYIYVAPGKHNPNSFDLYSSGKDRTPDTADDIGNWDN